MSGREHGNGTGPARVLRQRGVETVELAIILPVFLLLLFAILDFSRLFFTEITLQHAMREGGRFGVTGQRLPDPDDPDTLQSRVDSIKQVVEEAAVGISLDAEEVSIASVHGGQGSAGGPGDTFTISMSYRFSFVTPLVGQFFDDGAYTFTVSTTFRNEPFEPGTS
jgi:hypothetical protein